MNTHYLAFAYDIDVFLLIMLGIDNIINIISGLVLK